METLELIERISNGEDSYTQFKENITNNDKLSEELVAFSNSKGGILIIGVTDNNDIVGLSDDDIRRLNQLIGNVINSNITPPIYPITEIKIIEEKKMLIVTIEDGSNKPYSTNKGIYLTKAGSDKRKVSPEELRRLFAESKRLFADEEIVTGSDISDLNMQLYNNYLKKSNKEAFNKLKKGELDLTILLENEMIMKNHNLTLAGNLIFGINPQKFNKSFYINCCYFDGNNISVTKYISKKRIYGDFETLYNQATGFLHSNIQNRQEYDNFNSNGVPEISHEVIGELIVNALIHRDYCINSSIKVFMFYDRVEIISPGKLTNSLTIENIKTGRSICRNPTLDSICENILTYSGYGSGIKRALSINPNIEFINDVDKEEFKCIIPRKMQLIKSNE
jgi:predicted HTH transcriptional regulator